MKSFFSAAGFLKTTENGREAKASYQVKIGDVNEIAFGNRSLRVEVTDLSENAKKADAAAMYKEL